MSKKVKVEQFLQATRQYIVGIDTPEEVRAFAGYKFIVGLGDELEAQGVPSSLACKAAARVKCSLPTGFHDEFPEEFTELIALWAKTMAVTYKALAGDYNKAVIEDMYMSFCDKIVIEFSFA